MFMLILVILVVHVDARCGVSEGVVQCRDWREFERGNYPMANFIILERAMGKINVEEYPALTRLIIRDPQTNCDAITANAWTTVRIGSLTCQNGQHSSGVTNSVATTTIRTVELTAITFNKPWIYVILGGTGVVVLIFSVMIICAIKSRCLRRRVELEI
ncbi:uncharacterized protein LOC133180070 [Saccostrea echinata]|uniref:uncharacterized protein LOC133179980 n=1 Tax=Saccostrea echinata TaxID=191078 RepID=UPI002A7EE0A6|nr:uncharacterized protein LOC133179980 [Saccostrea echinata]XP_061170647.1 uncharacterized protein LOC133180070 [Saccostrea echinata]